jgi:hypothetical protein
LKIQILIVHMPLQVTGILYQIGFPSATHANPGRTEKKEPQGLALSWI